MYITLTPHKCQCDEFIDFWSSLYFYKQENLYLDNINKRSFSQNNLQDLFVWKNGMRLSSKKDTALNNKILRKVQEVNELKAHFSLERFEKKFLGLSTIWRVFLLHCIQPETYPIFDQHVYRAMYFFQNQTIGEIAKSDKQNYQLYKGLYVAFFDRIVSQSSRDRIRVDRALWSFGKALKVPLIKHSLNDLKR